MYDAFGVHVNERVSRRVRAVYLVHHHHVALVALPAEASAQYAAALEREALEPQTLAEVLAQQGQPALEAALKEALPGAPMGHRLRIISALSREVSP